MQLDNKDSRDAIFNEILKISKKDKNVITLTCDTGVQLFEQFKKEVPKQFFNVGIAEQNAISVASGLALSGKKVFVFGISNFVSMRCLEQIKIDICSMCLPITIIGMGAGYSYSSDGCTHHMIEDLSIIRTLPNITLWNISNNEMSKYIVENTYLSNKPNYIRFDKGPYFETPFKNYSYNNILADGFVFYDFGANLTLVTTGIMTTQAFLIQEMYNAFNIVDVFNLSKINEDFLRYLLRDSSKILVLEENCRVGGLSNMISDILIHDNNKKDIKFIGLNNVCRNEVGDREFMRSLDGLDCKSLIEELMEK